MALFAYLFAALETLRQSALFKLVKLAKKEIVSWDVSNEELLDILQNAQFDKISSGVYEDTYFSSARNRASEAFAYQSTSGSQSSQSSRSSRGLPFSSFRCSMAVKGYFCIRRIVLHYDRVGQFIGERLGITSAQLEEFLCAEACVLQMLRGCFVFYHNESSIHEVAQVHPVFKLFLSLFMKRLGKIIEGFVPYLVYNYPGKISGTIRVCQCVASKPTASKKEQQQQSSCRCSRLLHGEESVNQTVRLSLKGSVGDLVLGRDSKSDRSDLRQVDLLVELKRPLDQLLNQRLQSKSELLAQVHCVGQSLFASEKEEEGKEDSSSSSASCVKGLLTDLFAINLVWRFANPDPSDKTSGGDIFITSSVVSVREYLLGLLLTLCDVRNVDDMHAMAETVEVVDDFEAEAVDDEQDILPPPAQVQSQLQSSAGVAMKGGAVLSTHNESCSNKDSSSRRDDSYYHRSVGQANDMRLIPAEWKMTCSGYLSASALSTTGRITAVEKVQNTHWMHLAGQLIR